MWVGVVFTCYDNPNGPFYSTQEHLHTFCLWFKLGFYWCSRKVKQKLANIVIFKVKRLIKMIKKTLFSLHIKKDPWTGSIKWSMGPHQKGGPIGPGVHWFCPFPVKTRA